ncbi:hypothetical protein ACFQGT_09070 [Natrialbaceae archaeon GCM10025810]|uniref:hypothetical protein n=1 Tax=Halovalidus salilacus TaxID=3075124 RepID=UPI003614359A
MTDDSSPDASDTIDTIDRRTATESDDSSSRRGVPLEDLVASLEERASKAGDEPDAVHEFLERESVADLDTEALWERVEGERDPAPVDSETEREVREIEKASYCHRCEHFARPPEVACTYDGSEILEMASLDTFRVINCPVVLEDERLERENRNRR